MARLPRKRQDEDSTASGLNSMARLPRKRQDEDPPAKAAGESADASSARPQPHPTRAKESKQELSSEKTLRIYAKGFYNPFYFEHARSLEQAKKLFPNTYLLVGCCNDEVTPMNKGKTVMTAAEGCEALRHCRWVDEIIPDAPLVITQEFIDKHNIDFVAHDSLPYPDASGAGKDVYEFEKQLRVNMGITKLREKVKEQQEKVGKTLHTVAKTAGMHHDEWVENADRWVAGFLEKFEEGCHIMETAIKDRIQEGLKRQQSKEMTNLLQEQVAS